MSSTELIRARQAKHTQDEALRALHNYVYQQLRTGRKEEILDRARQRLALWKRDRLCSAYYIRFWTTVLNSDSTETFKAKVLEASARRANGMMQNTPFSFLMREKH
jgi:transcriptional regulator NrdR family protein